MHLLQLALMACGVALTASGAVIREMGAYYFVRDLSWLPCSDLLLTYPMGAMVVGVVLFVLGTRCSEANHV